MTNVIENNHTVFFDVDETLIFNVGVKHSHPQKIRFDFKGFRYYAVPHNKHVAALKKFKENGYTVVVWSHGRYEWAEAVVNALRLRSYVDIIISKPDFMYDDATLDENFMRTYEEDDNNPEKA